MTHMLRAAFLAFSAQSGLGRDVSTVDEFRYRGIRPLLNMTQMLIPLRMTHMLRAAFLAFSAQSGLGRDVSTVDEFRYRGIRPSLNMTQMLSAPHDRDPERPSLMCINHH